MEEIALKLKIYKMNIPDFKEHIHYDKQMESAILGACLIEKDALGKIRGLINRDCFYLENNQIVFDVINEMWENNYPIDLLTVAQFIVRNKGIKHLNSDGVPSYLCRLTNSVVSSAHIEYHSLLIRQLYAERQLLKIKYAPMGDGTDVMERTEKMRDELFKLTQIKVVNDWTDMIDVVLKLHKHMDDVKDKDIIGVPTGFEKFDLTTGGFCKSDMIVIGARPSVGKSAFLGCVSVNAAQKGYKVGIISLEMSDIQLGARMGSLISDVEFYKIFRNKIYEDQERDKLYNNLERLANLPIKISEKTNVNVNDIRAKIGQLVSKNQLDIVFIDYLQLMESPDGNKNYNREQEVSKMSRGLKLIAKEFNIPVVVLAQLNRDAEKSTNKQPQLHHLRESGAIEQDADLVVFLHRDFQSGILINEDGQSTEFEADLIVAKGRNIEKPKIKIGFNGPKMKFYDLENKQFNSINESTYRLPYKENKIEDLF